MTQLRDAEPITFDFEAARALAMRLRATADLLRSQIAQRDRLADAARREWEGAYERRFGARMSVCTRDCGRLADALDEAARQVDELARAEQDRRSAARAWKVEHDAWERDRANDNFVESTLGGLFGDGEPKPPNLTPTPPPAIPIADAAPATRA